MIVHQHQVLRKWKKVNKYFKAGSLTLKFPDRTQPVDKLINFSDEWSSEKSKGPWAPKIFGNAGIEHM